MPYCPACSAEVSVDAASCPRCRIIFGSTPASQPRTALAPPPAVATQAADADEPADTPPRDPGGTTGLGLLRAVVAAPLFFIGIVLLVLAAYLGRNGGELAGIPGALCLLAAISISRSKGTRSQAGSLVVGVLLLLLMWGLLAIVARAPFSR